MSVRQIYHHYERWEEFHYGMWKFISAEDARTLLPVVIEFTGDHVRYGVFMQRVIVEWPISCEQSLTNIAMNRRAWVGHAACCLATGSPEYVTRQAWKHLTQQQQDNANGQADRAIASWTERYETQNSRMGNEVGIQGLLQWDS